MPARPNSGRKPVPVALKLLRGNPGHQKIPPQIELPTDAPAAPDWLSPVARAEYDRIAGFLGGARVLTPVDAAALAAYAQAFARWIEAEAKAKGEDPTIVTETLRVVHNPAITAANAAMDQMLRLCTEFGMTPSSRARIKPSGDAGNVDPVEAFQRRKRPAAPPA